jgi:hypothetical protein
MNPKEIIDHNQHMLLYSVFIDILEVVDCHESLDTSSSSGGGGNSDFGEFYDFQHHCRSRPWPKQTRFSDVIEYHEESGRYNPSPSRDNGVETQSVGGR